MDYTIVIAANANDSAAPVAPYIGACQAEYFVI